MNNEIVKLKLPRGVWQGIMVKDLNIPDAKVDIEYTDIRTAMFRISSKGQKVGHFALSFLYGCRGVLVSHTMLIEPEYRGKGLAKKLQPIKKRIAKDLGVAVMLCTVVDENKAQETVIKDWQKVGSFDNMRTGNKVNLFTTKVV